MKLFRLTSSTPGPAGSRVGPAGAQAGGALHLAASLIHRLLCQNITTAVPHTPPPSPIGICSSVCRMGALGPAQGGCKMQGAHCCRPRSPPLFWEGEESMGAAGWLPEEQPERCPAPSSINVAQGQESHAHVLVSLSPSCISPQSIFGDNRCNVKNKICFKRQL